jgi:hypothetical protein
MVISSRPLLVRYASPIPVFPTSIFPLALIKRLLPPLQNRLITRNTTLFHALILASPFSWKSVCLIFLLSLFFQLTSLFVSDDPVPPITDQDHAVLKHAKNVVSDPIIVDITDESLAAAEFTQNSLRLQIIQGCQHLRSYTSSVDRLMGLYHDSIVANPPSKNT